MTVTRSPNPYDLAAVLKHQKEKRIVDAALGNHPPIQVSIQNQKGRPTIATQDAIGSGGGGEHGGSDSGSNSGTGSDSGSTAGDRGNDGGSAADGSGEAGGGCGC